MNSETIISRRAIIVGGIGDSEYKTSIRPLNMLVDREAKEKQNHWILIKEICSFLRKFLLELQEKSNCFGL
jgi:hypothetical protein